MADLLLHFPYWLAFELNRGDMIVSRTLGVLPPLSVFSCGEDITFILYFNVNNRFDFHWLELIRNPLLNQSSWTKDVILSLPVWAHIIIPEAGDESNNTAITQRWECVTLPREIRMLY